MTEQEFSAELDLLIRSRYPIIWIETWEEERIRRMVGEIATRLSKKLFVWDGCGNMRENGNELSDTAQPKGALEYIRASGDNAIFLLLDFHSYAEERDEGRLLRRIAFELKRSYKTVIVVSPSGNIPMELEKQVVLLDLPLPDMNDLMALLQRIISKVRKNPSLTVEADDALLEKICAAARGLTYSEAENLFLKAAVSEKRFGPEDLSLVISEKRQVLRKTGVLDYFESAETMKDVGGLSRLKNWLESRRKAFSEEARRFGLPEPKGLLLLGVQGCGKSLTAKAVANYWQLPLLRMDIGSLFSSYIGSTEANMRKALRIAESLAPAVLWLDEIEKGLSGLESSGSVDGGTTARVFSSFLLWMQEKRAPVFVVATANDVRRLPPELLRKGRFDEIFFVDLPSADERKDIFRIHIRRKNRDLDQFRIGELVKLTESFSGAEIEQIVNAALYRAFAAERELEQEDLTAAAAAMIPLSRTMSENIEALRSWARSRATPAS